MARKSKFVIEDSDIVNVGDFLKGLPADIDNVYAKPDHPRNQFTLGKSVQKTAIYKAEYINDKALWLQKDLAKIVAGACKYLPEGYSISLKDGLRTVDAQMAMLKVKEQNKWPDSLVSSPRQGAHPRGMAIDIMLLKDGKEVDAGTLFDEFDLENDPPKSSRIYSKLTDEQKENQRILERAIMRSAIDQDQLIMPLQDEHWDFRFPNAETSLEFVLKSIARIIKVEIPADKDISTHLYEDFKRLWDELFGAHKEKLISEFGVDQPPIKEPIYSMDYYPLMDSDLPKEKRVTDGSFKYAATAYLAEKGVLGEARPDSKALRY